MPVAKCWECGWEKRYSTIEEARAGARLHMGLTPHLMVFGYTDADYRAKSGIVAVEPNGEICGEVE